MTLLEIAQNFKDALREGESQKSSNDNWMHSLLVSWGRLKQRKGWTAEEFLDPIEKSLLSLFDLVRTSCISGSLHPEEQQERESEWKACFRVLRSFIYSPVVYA